jgi:CRP-like cAMP-binding protein
MGTSLTAADLAKLAMFRDLPDEALATLATHAQARDLATGEVLYEEGQPSTHVSFIVSGHMLLRIHRQERPIVVAAMGPGDVLGWASLRPEPIALNSAQANEPVHLISIPAGPILDLASSGTPEGRALIQRLMDVAARRLSRAHEQVVRSDTETVISGG